MRVGIVWEPATAAGHYRAVDPGLALARRGHQIVQPPSAEGKASYDDLIDCDVVHVYRRHDDETYGVMSRLARRGVAIVYDNDDDYLLVPEEHPEYEQLSGANGRERFDRTLRMAKLARLMTASTDPVAERYRTEGVEHVEVIPNCLRYDSIRPPRPHEGVVVGWVAGLEHAADVARIPLVEALERLVAKHEDVRVECIGVDLGLSQRYFHDELVQFGELSDRIAGFDIGIAPLADIPFNWARSDIKVKEYAACGVPWLASPIGPYRDLGEAEGGRLVSDDGWFDALDRLVRKARERRRLSAAAARWAKTQTIHSVAARWERLLSEAAAKPVAIPEQSA
jgi:glycosyltransferase involved in cell wall biosynthesis